MSARTFLSSSRKLCLRVSGERRRDPGKTVKTGRREMSNELTKPPPRELDGFETYEGGVEGEQERASGGVIQGPIIAFTNEAEWVRRDGEELPADLELVAVD